MSLPTPIGRQKEVLCLPAAGHFAVLGTAGSGKTTLAILRSAYLSDPSTDHGGRTLLVTFNKALVAYLRHLQDRSFDTVVTENYHLFARGYLNCRGRMSYGAICENDFRSTLIQQAVASISTGYEKHSFFEKPAVFFVEEVRWMEGHGIRTLEQYKGAERIGRGTERIPPGFRKVMFEIFQEYRTQRTAHGMTYDWDDLAMAVSDEFDRDAGARLYRHVVIDEGQDFSPEMIRSLAKAIPANGSLTFFGDMAQQIYGRSMSWRSSGLTIAKVWEFKENYRNTKQIAKLGLAISKMPYYRGTPDLVEPVSPSADGPLPTLVTVASCEKEVELVIAQALRIGKTQSVAILCRHWGQVKRLADSLAGAIRLSPDLTTWRAGPGIYYGAYHSAKGLEFDAVILPFLTADSLPDPDELAAYGREEAEFQDGKLLYVAVTRAKARLIMTYTGTLTELLPSSSDLYERLTR